MTARIFAFETLPVGSKKRSADLLRCSDVGVWHGKRAAVAAAHQAGGTGYARQRVIWAQSDAIASTGALDRILFQGLLAGAIAVIVAMQAGEAAPASRRRDSYVRPSGRCRWEAPISAWLQS